MVKRNTIGGRILEARENKDYGKTKLAELLTEEIKKQYPEKINKINVKDHTIKHWEEGTALQDFQIVALSNVLDVSCDWILKGILPEDQNITEDVGLSGKTLEWLRADKLDDEDRYWINSRIGDTWPQVVSFFFDNGFSGLLLEMRDYITRNVLYDMMLEREVFKTEENKILPNLTETDWADYHRKKLEDEIEKARSIYQARNRKEIIHEAERKIAEGGNPDGKTRKRRRISKKAE